ncbi:hypothetical protein [Legionella drancourtii]|uniref:Inclusion membrane protein A n=1 Tax=Legionella drancourtii LLAP12 TaxID=658187 RepID=G9EUM2_9GAMM|nr:hypothetical protein [Legionella drancourtii]EHL29022.1 hypothetical protein LDG_9020 [Legionella drancourtii LLAP12]
MAVNEKELQDCIDKDSVTEKVQTKTPVNNMGAKNVLAQLNFSDAAQELILDPNSFDKNTTGLASIASSNELLIQVRNSLSAIVDSLEENPSILTRLAKTWGTMSWLERISVGIALSAPTMAVGVIANVGFLVALSGLSAGAYITSGVVLQDHLDHTQLVTKKIKEGIFGIADVLVLTISALDTIRQKLLIEVERFKAENGRLHYNVNDLSEQIDVLRVQIESNMLTEQHLRQTQAELQSTAAALKNDMEKNQVRYDETIYELEKTNSAHKKINDRLNGQVTELEQKREALALELKKTKALATTLQGTVETLAKAVINDTQQRQNFQKRLDGFLENGSQSFVDFAERIGKTEAELQSVKVQLERSLQHHAELMRQQEELITRLERIDRIIPAIHAHQGLSDAVDLLLPADPLIREQQLASAGALCTLGLMGNPKPNKSDSHQPNQTNTP